MQGDLELQLDNAIPTPEDEERTRIRAEYRQRLAEKLKDPEFRKIEGFPIGTDEAILALSDPPYYTACPNPFIEEWLQQNCKPYAFETDNYHREPFAADVSEGKNDPIYNAHSYHTKVPHKAIMRYILHYTEPGDVVYDGFCGTGMTGVASQMCGDSDHVESLGYKVTSDNLIFDDNFNSLGKLGFRRCILNDLSPAATLIAHNYNTSVNSISFQKLANDILQEIGNKLKWMYTTLHETLKEDIVTATSRLAECQSEYEIIDLLKDYKTGIINYVVWSDVFICPNCGKGVIFYDVAVNREIGKVADEFECNHCKAKMTKRTCDRAFETIYDNVIGDTINQAKQVPVLITYSINNKRFEKKPDQFDLSLISKINTMSLVNWFPCNELPDGYNTEQPKVSHGLTHVYHFYTSRNLRALSLLYSKINEYDNAPLRLLFQSAAVSLCSKLVRYNMGNRGNGLLPGTLFVSSMPAESNVFKVLTGKVQDFVKAFGIRPNQTYIAVNSASASYIHDNSMDYIFTDPPFGGNLMYSELNFMWESWCRVTTNVIQEAITNEKQQKHLYEYQQIMTRCFAEYYRVLKPGRWMTVEFHNSSNAVWNSIQEALQHVGFIIADTRVLDKQQGSFKQVTTTAATKVDLVISCYKPHSDFENRFLQVKGQTQGVVEFVRQHLEMLPVVPISKDGKIEVIVERTRYLLFDRMVAYHLQQGARIPISAAEFYQMLNEQFVERDDEYFLPDQAAKYDALRSRTEVEQLSIFIRDERSAVQWARTQLLQSSQTLGDLTPKFMQETRDWESHEPRPELRDILKENFIIDEDGKWRVPDPNQEKDLEALRLKGMLKTFESYVKTKGQLKIFRKEAIVEGFKHCWQTKQFGVIVTLCERIPAKILQEVPEFVQFYDIAKDLAPTETAQLEFSWEG